MMVIIDADNGDDEIGNAEGAVRSHHYHVGDAEHAR